MKYTFNNVLGSNFQRLKAKYNFDCHGLNIASSEESGVINESVVSGNSWIKSTTNISHCHIQDSYIGESLIDCSITNSVILCKMKNMVIRDRCVDRLYDVFTWPNDNKYEYVKISFSKEYIYLSPNNVYVKNNSFPDEFIYKTFICRKPIIEDSHVDLEIIWDVNDKKAYYHNIKVNM